MDLFNDITFVNVGDCRGTDKLVIKYCKENNINYKIFPYIKELGLGGGPARNKIMIDNSDCCIAFLSPLSKGTLQTINYANSKKIDVYVFNI